MSKESSPLQHNSKIEEREAIERLKNSDISYAIALALNHKYDFGGYSVGRSERSYLLDMYFRLNKDSHNNLDNLNPFEDGDLFVEEARKRMGTEYVGDKQELDENNPEDLSCIILRLWIKHYREKMAELGDGGFAGTNVDYSFQSESERAELLYKLYIEEKNVNEDALEKASMEFVNPEDSTLNKYRVELNWKVSDLVDCVE